MSKLRSHGRDLLPGEASCCWWCWVVGLCGAQGRMCTHGDGSAAWTGDVCRARCDAGAQNPPSGGFGFPLSTRRWVLACKGTVKGWSSPDIKSLNLKPSRDLKSRICWLWRRSRVTFFSSISGWSAHRGRAMWARLYVSDGFWTPKVFLGNEETGLKLLWSLNYRFST